MPTANKIWKDISSTVAVNKWFDDFAVINHIDETVRHKLNMVIDDLIMNIISYAFSETADSEVEVRLELNTAVLVFTIIDNGKFFNPLEKEKPDTTLPITEREIGGLGIYLSRELMDYASYQRIENKNIIKLSVHVPQRND